MGLDSARQSTLIEVAGGGDYLGGPASTRRRIGPTSKFAQSDSIHQVAPASAHGRTAAAAAPASVAELDPSITMSNPSRLRRAATQSRISASLAGVSGRARPLLVASQ